MNLIEEFNDFTLLVGNSVDIFDYFNVEELHGLKRAACYDGRFSAYIAGLCNLYPNDNRRFIFLNINRLGHGYKDILLIFHEAMHLSLLIYGTNLEYNEEDVISYAEKTTDEIYLLLKYKIYSGS